MEDIIVIDGKSTSIHDAELWGHIDDKNAYLRFRTGKLEIRIGDSWSNEANTFISEDDAEIIYKKEYPKVGPKSELLQKFSSWEGVLEETPYEVSTPFEK